MELRNGLSGVHLTPAGVVEDARANLLLAAFAGLVRERGIAHLGAGNAHEIAIALGHDPLGQIRRADAAERHDGDTTRDLAHAPVQVDERRGPEAHVGNVAVQAQAEVALSVREQVEDAGGDEPLGDPGRLLDVDAALDTLLRRHLHPDDESLAACVANALRGLAREPDQWIPAFAGMTVLTLESRHSRASLLRSGDLPPLSRRELRSDSGAQVLHYRHSRERGNPRQPRRQGNFHTSGNPYGLHRDDSGHQFYPRPLPVDFKTNISLRAPLPITDAPVRASPGFPRALHRRHHSIRRDRRRFDGRPTRSGTYGFRPALRFAANSRESAKDHLGATMIATATRASAIALVLASATGHATPLYEEYGEAAQEALVEFLAAGPEARNDAGDSPLHWAVDIADVAAVRALLAAGGDADAKNRAGHTPLHWAAAGESDAAVAMLIEGRSRSRRRGRGGQYAVALGRVGRVRGGGRRPARGRGGRPREEHGRRHAAA